MKRTRYTKYVPDPAGEMSMEDLLNALSDHLLQSGFDNYGYYDQASQWHANAVGPETARGYYDRDGAWVDGAPNGYYDRDNRWVASNASGYYDQSGRWNAGPANGAYDSNGHWMRGAVNGHRDGNGLWVMDAQPGYYDGGGHWRAGVVQGHYDERGAWIPTSVDRGPIALDPTARPHRDIDSREAWLERRINPAAGDGTLSHRSARHAMASLNRIRQREAGLRDDAGRLSQRDEIRLQARLDQLDESLGLTNR